MGQGIDYGMGRTNIDHATGIRYGVISQHSISAEVFDDIWRDGADYGDPTCPKCGDPVGASDDAPEDVQELDWFDHKDYYCQDCQDCYWSDSVYSEDPLGFSYAGEGYELADCLQNDVFILKSDFYTFARFCSPCVPGAGNLDSADPDGAKTFCLSHDWFDDGKAPYPVYRVSDDTEVLPDARVFVVRRLDEHPTNTHTFGSWVRVAEFATRELADAYVQRAQGPTQKLAVFRE